MIKPPNSPFKCHDFKIGEEHLRIPILLIFFYTCQVFPTLLHGNLADFVGTQETFCFFKFIALH